MVRWTGEAPWGPPTIEHEATLANTTLPADPTSAGQARRFVAGVLDGVNPTFVEDTVLLVSELVTNTITHAGTPVTVDVRIDDRCIHIEVVDGDSRIPEPQQPDIQSSTGRGLAIVKSQASRWGVRPGAAGKAVWFEIDF